MPPLNREERDRVSLRPEDPEASVHPKPGVREAAAAVVWYPGRS